MNKIVVIILALFSVNENIHISSDQDQETNLFHQINENIKDLVDKTFSLLLLRGNFTSNHKISVLLLILRHLETLAENNYEILKHIRNVSKLNLDNHTVKQLFNLTDVIGDVFKENFNVVMDSKDTLVEFYDRIDNAAEDALHTLQEDAYAIRKETNPKLGVNNLTLKNVFGTLNRWNRSHALANDVLMQTILRRFRLNLRLWRPSNTSEDVVWNSTDTRRVFHGKGTSVSPFPFVASVHVMREFVCAGSIISQDLVLTAATCLLVVYNDKDHHYPSGVSVRLGSDFTQHSGELVPVSRVHFHPGFEPSLLRHNLAIVALSRRSHFMRGNLRLRKISYDWEGMEKDDMTDGAVTLLGWGDKDDRGSNGSEPLSYAELDIYDLEACKEIYTRKYVTDYNFCAGFIKKGGACYRDVGGPGVHGEALAGVVSFGPPQCGAPGAPTVFTRLAFYTTWIHSILRKESPTNAMLTIAPQKKTSKDLVRIPRASDALNLLNILLSLSNKDYETLLETLDDEPKGHVQPHNLRTPSDIPVSTTPSHQVPPEEMFIPPVAITTTTTPKPYLGWVVNYTFIKELKLFMVSVRLKIEEPLTTTESTPAVMPSGIPAQNGEGTVTENEEMPTPPNTKPNYKYTSSLRSYKLKSDYDSDNYEGYYEDVDSEEGLSIEYKTTGKRIDLPTETSVSTVSQRKFQSRLRRGRESTRKQKNTLHTWYSY